MKRYTYHIEITISVDAENEEDALEIVELLLPDETSHVKHNLIDLTDEEPISFEEAVADCWNDERKL